MSFKNTQWRIDMQIKKGFCECGCCNLAPIAKITSKRKGHKKGVPVRFIHGHNIRVRPVGWNSGDRWKGLSGEKHPNWKGGVKHGRNGRVRILRPAHARANKKGYVLRSILLAEKALGKSLPSGAQVHHFDNDPSNDSSNLVICENHAYHFLLHKRKRAYEACGISSYLKCRICKKYDHHLNLYVPPKGGSAVHRICRNEYQRERKRN
jgi:hypothetical protein